MTGPEHYRASERLLAAADEYDDEGDTHAATQHRLEALTRAVLALTASHAIANHPESIAWEQAINPKKQQ